jgi:hypothetical protein
LFYAVLCIVCVYMCTDLLPPGGYPIAVKYIISYHIISYHISYHIISYHIISYYISYIVMSCHVIYHIIYHISYIVYHISYIIYHIIYHIVSCHISMFCTVSLRLMKRHIALLPAVSPYAYAKLVHLTTFWVNSIQKIYVQLRIASVTTLCNIYKKRKLNKEPLKLLCRYKNVLRD